MARPSLHNLTTLGIIGVFASTVIVLSLSDRVPILLPNIMAAVFDFGRWVDELLGFELITREQVPGSRDQIGHALLWGSGMFAIGLWLRRSIPVLGIAFTLLVLSVGVEFAQRRWTSTRAMQVSDAVANAFGIVTALVGVLVVGAIIDLAARLWRFVTRPGPRSHATVGHRTS